MWSLGKQRGKVCPYRPARHQAFHRGHHRRSHHPPPPGTQNAHLWGDKTPQQGLKSAPEDQVRMEKSFPSLGSVWFFLPSFLTHLGNCFSSSRSGHRCGGLHQPPHCSPPLAACREGGQGAPQSATHPLRLGANPLGLGQPKSLIPPITLVPITGVHKHRIKLVFVCVCPSCMSASSGIWGVPGFRVMMVF